MISLETYNTLQHTGKLTEPHHSLDQDHDGSNERSIGSRWNSEITPTKEEINHYHIVYITKPNNKLK